MGAIAIGFPASAQDFRQGAPKELPQQQPKIETPDSPPPVVPEDDFLAVQEVRGLVFLPSRWHLDNRRDTDAGTGITIIPRGKDEAGVDLDTLNDPAFMALANALVGKGASLGDLDRFAYQIVQYYRSKGKPLVDVRVPEQDITDGVIRFVITEFRVDEVFVKGVRVEPNGRITLTEKPAYFNARHIRRALRMKRDSRILDRRVVEDLNWLATNPFRRVDLIYKKDDELGYTDVTMRVTERRPFRAYVGFENTGTSSTQRERWSAGFNWGNVFDLDHQFSYQFTASQNFFEQRPGNPDPSFTSHSFTYIAPLDSGLTPLHDSLTMFGTYQRTSPSLGPFFGLTGKNYQLSTRYNLQLPGDIRTRQQFSIGYDYKRTNNNLLFGGALISDTVTEVHQAVLEYSGSRTWRIGGDARDAGLADNEGSGIVVNLRVGNTLNLSPGGIGSHNTDAAFQPRAAGTLGPGDTGQAGTPFAEAQYIYNRLTVSPSVRFENGIEAHTRVTWQIADGNLLPSEQLSAAGPGFVRGYEPSALLATNGLLISQEVSLPAIPLFAPSGKIRDGLQFGIFYDYGRVFDSDRLAGSPDSLTGESAGFVVNYSLGSYLTARLDYGWQLRKLPGATTRGSLGFLSVTLGF